MVEVSVFIHLAIWQSSNYAGAFLIRIYTYLVFCRKQPQATFNDLIRGLKAVIGVDTRQLIMAIIKFAQQQQQQQQQQDKDKTNTKAAN